jgi:DNA-binding response OmpR family regulator
MSDPHTILIVDDEVDVLEMIEVGLQVTGYELLLAESGERASCRRSAAPIW